MPFKCASSPLILRGGAGGGGGEGGGGGGLKHGPLGQPSPQNAAEVPHVPAALEEGRKSRRKEDRRGEETGG